MTDTAFNPQPEALTKEIGVAYSWGHLLIGTTLSGFAVWKLLHKVTHTEPSAWFLGLSAAYEEVRDFVTIPFGWLHLNLTADEKSLVVVSAVLAAGLVRAMWHHRQFAGAFLAAAIPTAFAIVLTFRTMADPAIFPQTPSKQDALNALIDSFFKFMTTANAALDTIDSRPEVLSITVLLFFISIVVPFFSLFVLMIMPFLRRMGYSGNLGVDPGVPKGLYRLVILNMVFSAGWGTALLLLNWATS